MPIIKRDDGVTFAVYTYRELLTAKSASMLKQEVRMLREEHGEYARFFQLPSGDFEAVFSREQGYLLGETVWDFFEQPEDLIFCEALEDGQSAILVVVRGSSVYLDAEVPLENLLDEFSSLVTGAHSYDIYVYGDVPLAETPTEGKFAFDKECVNSFEVLKKAVFPQLPQDSNFELIPVAQAMDELPVGKQKQIVVAIVAVIVIAGLGWYFFKPAPPPPPPVVEEVGHVAPPPAPTDPYQNYKKELTSPSPYDVLNELAMNLWQMFTLPGWVPTTVLYENGKYTIDLESVGGTMNILLAWAEKNNNVNLSNDGAKATVIFQSNVQNRPTPTKIYDMDKVNAIVYDRLNFTMAGGQVSYKQPIKQTSYSVTELSVNFSNLSPNVLTLVGVELIGLPVVLEKCTLQVTTGLVSGTLDLKIFGAD